MKCYLLDATLQTIEAFTICCWSIGGWKCAKLWKLLSHHMAQSLRFWMATLIWESFLQDGYRVCLHLITNAILWTEQFGRELVPFHNLGWNRGVNLGLWANKVKVTFFWDARGIIVQFTFITFKKGEQSMTICDKMTVFI